MIAIHKSSSGFSGSWIKYCAENSILYKEVNCYDTDIVKHLKGCKALLWHHHHSLTKDAIFAKQLLFIHCYIICVAIIVKHYHQFLTMCYLLI